MLVYVANVSAPSLARITLESCKSLGLEVANLDYDVLAKPYFVAMFMSNGNFPRGKLLYCTSRYFASRNIVPPPWTHGTQFKVALNAGFANELPSESIRARLTDAIREADKTFQKELKRANDHVAKTAKQQRRQAVIA